MKGLRLFISSIAAISCVLAIAGLICLFIYRDKPSNDMEAKYTRDTSRFIQVDDVRFHVIQEGIGPDIVLLHGSFGSLFMWDDWANQLSDKYRITRLDLIGHGLTGPGGREHYSTDDINLLLASLIDELGLEAFHMVGTSQGGIAAFTYAAEHPEKVSSLVLINSAGLIHKNIDLNPTNTVPLKSRLLSRVTPKNLVEKFVRRLIGNDDVVTPELIETYYDLIMREGNRQALLSGFQYYKPRDPAPWLERITAPTLIIWSDRSVLPEAEAKEFAQALGSDEVSVNVIAGGGHALPISNPGETADLTVKFWQGLSTDTLNLGGG